MQENWFPGKADLVFVHISEAQVGKSGIEFSRLMRIGYMSALMHYARIKEQKISFFNRKSAAVYAELACAVQNHGNLRKIMAMGLL